MVKKIQIIVLLLIITVLSCGCGKENDASKNPTDSKYMTGIRIMEYESQNVILQMGADDSNITITLLNLVNDTIPTEEKVDVLPSYIINFIDNSHSQQDVWANIYIRDRILYVQYIPEKMPISEKLGITDEVRKSQISYDEFMNVLKKGE